MLPTDKTDDKDEENATPVDGDIIGRDVCKLARELGERIAVLAAGGTHHSAGGRHTLSHSQTKNRPRAAGPCRPVPRGNRSVFRAWWSNATVVCFLFINCITMTRMGCPVVQAITRNSTIY